MEIIGIKKQHELQTKCSDHSISLKNYKLVILKHEVIYKKLETKVID